MKSKTHEWMWVKPTLVYRAADKGWKLATIRDIERFGYERIPSPYDGFVLMKMTLAKYQEQRGKGQRPWV